LKNGSTCHVGDRVDAPVLVAVEQGEQVVGGDVGPVNSAGHPCARLIGVQDVGRPELFSQFVEETAEPARCFGRQARQPTGRHRCPAHLGEQLGCPGHRDVLAIYR